MVKAAAFTTEGTGDHGEKPLWFSVSSVVSTTKNQKGQSGAPETVPQTLPVRRAT